MMLSPIRFLLSNIKNVFSINSEQFFEAINETLNCSDKLKYQIKIISDEMVGVKSVGARWFVETNRIEINECLLCAIWASSYFVANAYVSLCDYLNGNKDSLILEEDSIGLIKYAKSLVPSFAEWPCELPIPQDFERDQYANLANLIMPIASDVVLCHEFAHMHLKHNTANYHNEIEADNLAVNWIVNNSREKYPIKELALMSAFVTMTIIDAQAGKDGERHPSSFSRMNNYLASLEIEDNDILWAFAIITYRAWEKSFNQVPRDLPKENQSFKEIFVSHLIRYD